MTLFAGCEFLLDHGTLEPMMGGIAAGFAGTFGQFSGKHPIVLGNNADERLPEKARRCSLSIARAQDSVTLLAVRSLPDPATLARHGDAFHEACLADNFHRFFSIDSAGSMPRHAGGVSSGLLAPELVHSATSLKPA
jgi:hypothetical protein